MIVQKDQFKMFIVPILVILALFFFAAYFAQQYNDTLVALATGLGNSLGILIYIAITIASVIVPPFSSAPLIPLAANTWGFFLAAVFSIIGWVSGSMAAFFIARIYGVPLVSKIVALEKIHKIQTFVSSRHVFWSVVILRMVVPVDILSYALGLFSVIGWKKYALATALGVAPFAFVFAYAGTLPLRYQLIAFFIVTPVIVLWILRTRKRFSF